MFAVVLSLINEQSPDVFNVGIKCEYLSLMNQVNILSPVRISIVVAHDFHALAQRRFFLFLWHLKAVLSDGIYKSQAQARGSFGVHECKKLITRPIYVWLNYFFLLERYLIILSIYQHFMNLNSIFLIQKNA